MIVEVNEAGEILIPAELVQAAPRTRLEADREGDLLVLKPLPRKPELSRGLVDSLPVVKGRVANPNMTFRREDIYGSDAR
jgi:bifunctional DNA-binding transcriptional regulator/antitoxin component of YhaV-PrlF toxin-antitoxin module